MVLATLIALAAPQAVSPIMTITVQKLPPAYKQAPIVHIAFTNKGTVESCSVEQSSGSAGIDKVACAQVQANVKLPVEKKKAPEARSAPVEFVTSAPAAPQG